jgi:hypothetical protein
MRGIARADVWKTLEFLKNDGCAFCRRAAIQLGQLDARNARGAIRGRQHLASRRTGNVLQSVAGDLGRVA